jgi:hypothetical protein
VAIAEAWARKRALRSAAQAWRAAVTQGAAQRAQAARCAAMWDKVHGWLSELEHCGSDAVGYSRSCDTTAAATTVTTVTAAADSSGQGQLLSESLGQLPERCCSAAVGGGGLQGGLGPWRSEGSSPACSIAWSCTLQLTSEQNL